MRSPQSLEQAYVSIGVDIVGIFVQWERVILIIALSETDAIGRLRRCDDDFLNAQFASCFDDVVGAHNIAAETFVVRHDHVSGIRGEMDHSVWRTGVLGQAVFVHVEKRGQGIHSLTAVGEVGLQRKY